jgi:hypothetical protein
MNLSKEEKSQYCIECKQTPSGVETQAKARRITRATIEQRENIVDTLVFLTLQSQSTKEEEDNQ